MAYTTIDNPELYMQVKLYTGTGSELAITLDGDEDMAPDLVWLKCRSNAHNHWIFDTVRGATKNLYPNLTTAEATEAQSLKSFGSDGFTLGTESDINGSSKTNVAWCWKESATAGFDINIHTGSGSSADISHNLSAVPELIFTKRRNDTQQWFTFTTITGSQKCLFLDTNSAISTQASAYDALPTSSVTNYGNDVAVNGSSDTYVAYLWRSVQGFSKFGSYTGNGNADGIFIYTGFKPAFILIKRTDAVADWVIADNKRDSFNLMNKKLFPAEADAEYTGQNIGDFVSNGIKLRDSATNNYSTNISGATYTYMAFAEAPFVNSNGVPCNAR